MYDHSKYVVVLVSNGTSTSLGEVPGTVEKNCSSLLLGVIGDW
jgi:hypothetical protein